MDPSTYIWSPKLNRGPSRPRKGQKTAIFDTETGLEGPLLTFFGLLCIPTLRGCGWENAFFSFLHLCHASRARGDAWKMRVLFSEPRKLTIGLAVWEALDRPENPLAGPNWPTLMGTWALFSLRPIRDVDQLTYGRKKNQPRAVESPRANPYLFTGDSENLWKQKCLEMNQNQFLWTLAHIFGHPNSTGALPDQEKAKKWQFLTQKRVWRAPFWHFLAFYAFPPSGDEGWRMSFFLFIISVKDRLWQMGLPIGEEVSPALIVPDCTWLYRIVQNCT